MVGRRSTKTVFFFSSRRRHTRFDCDWRSDVCSSDLLVFLKSGLLFVWAMIYTYELSVMQMLSYVHVSLGNFVICSYSTLKLKKRIDPLIYSSFIPHPSSIEILCILYLHCGSVVGSF